MILAFCWSHVRRDYIEAAAGQERLTQWCQEWIERIAEIFRLNDARLEHYKPGRKRQTAAFRKATRKLKKALDRLFAHAEAELAALPEHAREGKALRSLLNHREGCASSSTTRKCPSRIMSPKESCALRQSDGG